MADEAGKSSTISRRRELLEEVLVERSKAVAALPIDDQDPSAGSWQWPTGVSRLVLWTPRELDRRRQVALDVAVVALAWLEAIDEELATDRAAPREG